MSKRIAGTTARKVLLGVALLSVVGAILTASCGNSSAASAPQSGRIRPVSVTAVVQGDTVSVPASTVQRDRNDKFTVKIASIEESFMIYQLNGQIYARASVCPPCQSRSFSLVGNTLVCDSCGSVFDATTGKGISGPCRGYPKASVPYLPSNGNIVMKNADLLAAFQKTLSP